MRAANLLGSLVSVFFPPSCAICAQAVEDPAELICLVCRQDFEKVGRNVCPICGARTQRRVVRRCPSCPEGEVFFESARGAVIYAGRIREAIHLFKYTHHHELGRPLARVMFMGLPELCEENEKANAPDFLIPVPMHFLRRALRGYNHSSVLAAEISLLAKAPVREDLLIRNRHTPRQALVPRERRLENIRGAFTAPHPALIRDKRIALVDDVLTSGSTVNECARTLVEAGAASVKVHTLARA
jgi:ComF family protein